MDATAHEMQRHRMKNRMIRKNTMNEQVGKCSIMLGDSRELLSKFIDEVDLIVTSPPYADARCKHYDSVHPDQFAEWFLTFHDSFYNALKPNGSFVLNINS